MDDEPDPPINEVKVIKRDFLIQPIDKLDGGGDVHESMNVDSRGMVSGGHTTIRGPGDISMEIGW